MNIFKNFLYILKRYKTSSILNVLGLSAAIFVFFITAIQVHFDLTFNDSFKNSKNIYQMITNQDGNYDRNVVISSANAILNAAPEIKNIAYSSMNTQSGVSVLDSQGDKKLYDDHIAVVNKGFIEMFEPEVVEGNIATFFSGTNKLMISRKTALRLFGAESSIGKTVFYKKSKIERVDNVTRTVWEETPGTVTVVFKDFPKNTTFDNVIFTVEDVSDNYVYEAYFEIEKSSIEHVLKKINTKEVIDQVAFFIDGGHISYDGKAEKEKDIFKEIRLEPIRNIQTRYPQIIAKGSDIKTVYFMTAIGVFVLIIAFINFVNFSAALAPTRMKSVNIQRILGESKSKLRFVISMESLLYCLLSCLIALIGIVAFDGSSLQHLFTADFSLQNNAVLLACLIGALLSMALVIGFYPANYLTNFKPASLFNNSGIIQRSKFRYSLIVLQFVAAIMLTAIALFMKWQINYMQNYTTGIEKNNIVYVNNAEDKENNVEKINSKNFAQEVVKNTIVSDFTLSSDLPGAQSNNFMMTYIDGEEFRYKTWGVDDNFPAFFGLTFFEGKTFDRIAANRQAIVNRAFVGKNKVKDIIGKRFISYDLTSDTECSGVVNDFNFEPLNNTINPLLMESLDDETLRYIFFKIQNKNTEEAISHIKNTWKTFSNREIEVEFLDKVAERQYKIEKNMMNLVSIASLIIILIAIMGVYGLITFSMKSKSKEIAIRKINGAGEKSIMLLVNRNLLIQFVIGFVASIVPSYWVVEKWLEQFPYKTDIHWWIFALAGLIIAFITFIAVSWQSWRASTANPVESLKTE